MRLRPVLFGVLSCLLVLGSATPVATQAQSASTCNLASPAFCDTFDQPFNGGGRTGQLDPNRWSVSRVSGMNYPDGGLANKWVPSDAMHCKTPVSGVIPDQDYFMCGPETGESMHFMEAFTDNGSYLYNSARIRQPFDFANRTGTIAYEVDAKTAGSHSWWVEVWITDEPIPAPHVNHIPSLPRNAVGLAFHDNCHVDGVQGSDAGSGLGSVGEIARIQNYTITNDLPPWAGLNNGLNVQQFACYDTMPDMKNHFQIRINQQHLEVWASGHMDANLKLIETVDGLNLPFTRGFVHFQHAQYDAYKSGVTTHQTYHWDNIGFDGPTLPVPAMYSLPDALLPVGSPDGSLNVGYVVDSGGLRRGPINFTNVNLAGATSVAMSLNGLMSGSRDIVYQLNGGAWHTFTAGASGDWQPLLIPLNIAELRNGTNSVNFRWGGASAVANLDLIMNGVNSTPVATSVPPTSTPVPPTVTPLPPTATVVPSTPTAVPPTPTPGTQFSQNLSPGDSLQVTCAGTLSLVTQSQTSDVLACSP